MSRAKLEAKQSIVSGLMCVTWEGREYDIPLSMYHALRAYAGQDQQAEQPMKLSDQPTSAQQQAHAVDHEIDGIGRVSDDVLCRQRSAASQVSPEGGSKSDNPEPASAARLAAPEGCVVVPAKGLLAVRDAILDDDHAEAWHQLYTLVPWNDPYHPWDEWECLAAAKEGK